MGLDSLRDFWNSTPAASIKPGGASYATQHLAWQLTGDKTFLESLYGGQIEWSRLREYINTLGSLWIDRVDVPSIELQRARLGGVALARNVYFPGHAVSWRFHSPASAESVAILIPRATPRALEVIVHNLSPASVRASMTAWDLEPGSWRVAQGIDSNRDDAADTEMSVQNTELERTRSLELTFPAGQTTVLDLALLAPGTPYWSRPDLAISTDDVAVRGDRLSVTIHSVGAVDAPPAELALVDASGKVLESTAVPAMKAPIDLLPKVVTLTLPAHSRVAGRALVLDPQLKVEEITRFNNRVEIGGP
jgi:hypothetical protein